ncbi:MAG: thiamine phosphate synthase [Alphaproteobacteria bacterium]|nr:thiamine phosphate synthase [Alphaproteobacteria bacterium]
MRTPRFDVSVYGVLDPARTHGRSLGELADAAIRGGVTFLQFRSKTQNTRRFLDAAFEVVKVTRARNVPLVINDRVDIAYAVDADGVHLGDEDMPAAQARRLLGKDAIIGQTVHSVDEAQAFPIEDADYFGVGAVYATSSKQRDVPPIGPEGFAKIRRSLATLAPGKPVVGIAGITWENCGSVMAAKADGVAVISDIFMADDVEAAARRLASAVRGNGEVAA